jgi:hypothetical protein
VNNEFNQSDLRPKEPGIYPASMLGVAIKGTVEGQSWRYEATMVTRPGSGRKKIRGRLIRAGDMHEKDVAEILELQSKVAGERLHALIVLPASDLLKPILDHFIE